MTPERAGKVSRRVENAGLALGLTIMGLYGLAEVAIYVVVSLGWRPYVNVPMPKVILLLALMCVLPKYLGRATAGQVWLALTTRLLPGKGPEPPASSK